MTDEEIASYADYIFEQVRSLKNPADATAILVLAQFNVIKESYEPEGKSVALKAVDEQCDLLKQFVNEGWQ